MPDAELFAAAVAGELATRAGVERQVRRMLDDPKARPAVVHFHNQWLGTDQVLRVAPARRAFGPLFGITPEIEWSTCSSASRAWSWARRSRERRPRCPPIA